MVDVKQRQENLNKLRRELQRRSLDQLKLFNPLKEEFNTTFDGFVHVVPPQKEAIFPRYVAEKWMKEFIDYMINEEERVAVETENSKRRGKGWEPLNPQERDQLALRQKLITSNVEKRTKYMKKIYRGISKEYGLDLPVIEPKKISRMPVDEEILKSLDEEMGIIADETESVEETTSTKKENLIKDISDGN